MEIKLNDEFILKKMDKYNPLDIELAKELQSDNLVNGDIGGYVSDIYLKLITQINESLDMYGLFYSIYLNEYPIGYLEISKKLEFDCISLFYAIKECERKKGYGSFVLNQISNIILKDSLSAIKEIILTIDYQNIYSQKTALKSGFVRTNTDNENSLYHFYSKKKPF